MFHVMLVLPILGPALAVFGVILAVILGLPYWVGLGLQAILTLVTDNKKLLVIPAILGAICAGGYFFLFLGVVPIWFQVLYWAVFFLCLWLVWFVVSKLRALALNWMKGR